MAATTPATNLLTRLGELKDSLTHSSKASPGGSPDLHPSKRPRQYSPISDLSLTNEDLESLQGVDPSVIRAFNCLFDAKLAEVIKPYNDIIEQLRGVIAQKDDRISELEAQLAASQENPLTSASTELLEIRKKNDDFEQKLRQNHVRLHGVPDSDNTHELVCKIARSVDVDLTVRDINISHYNGQPDPHKKGRQLMVYFINNQDKLALLRNRKKLRNTDEYKNVYVNEDLTKPRYTLLRSLQAKCKEKTIHASWAFRGKIFFKRTDSKEEKPTLIKNVLTFNVNDL